MAETLEIEIIEDLNADIEAVSKISAVPSMLDVISKTLNMRFVAIARVTDSKWITCASLDHLEFGLKPGDELPILTTFCNIIREKNTPVIIDEVAKDPIYSSHAIPEMYGFQSYISYPIYRKNGTFFGTLCAIDTLPAKVNMPEVDGMFRLFTDLISFHLDTVEALELTTARLREERKIAELRETFIAILGHDLRNPVGTTRICADILLNSDLPKNAKKHAQIIKSTSYRMQGLIDNLLDFAKGHLGGGINLSINNDKKVLEKSLRQVIKEMITLDKEHTIKADINIKQAVSCDPDRIAQLFSNLLGNAIKHGAKNESILCSITSDEDQFKLSVTNKGHKILKTTTKELFKPFFKKDNEHNKSGLGLGLYICSEIAKAHHGKMHVESSKKQTTFSFTMSATFNYS